MDETDGDGVQEMQLATAGAAGRDEICRLQHTQVLHDAEAGHSRQGRLQLLQRLAVALEEPIEEDPPVDVGQRPEGRLVIHVPNYM